VTACTTFQNTYWLMAVVMKTMQQVQVDLGVGEVDKGLALGRVVMGEVVEGVAAASAVVASLPAARYSINKDKN
jgi:hypothetical protein